MSNGMRGFFEPIDSEERKKLRDQLKEHYIAPIFIRDLEYLAKDKTPEELYELYVLILLVDKGMDRQIINKQLDDIVAVKERIK